MPTSNPGESGIIKYLINPKRARKKRNKEEMEHTQKK